MVVCFLFLLLCNCDDTVHYVIHPETYSAVIGFGVLQIGIRALFIVNQVYQPIKDIRTINTSGLKHSDQKYILLSI